MDNWKTFQYTYSAREQQELQEIRSKYVPKEESKMDRLRRLDGSVTRKATAWSLGLGVIGSLLLGLGMSCCMVWQSVWFVPGVILGLLGMGLMGAAYPVYGRTVKKERERIAPEILRLTDELMK